MITYLANRLALFIAKNDSMADPEILSYGYEMIIFESITTLLLFLSALITGVFFEMLCSVLICTVMRLLIGGSHAKSRIICFITYTAQMYICIALSLHVQISFEIKPAIFLLNLILLILYAPADTEELPITKNIMHRKIFGIFITTIFFILSIIIGNGFLANIFVIMPTFNSFFVHPFIYILFGCKKSTLRRT